MPGESSFCKPVIACLVGCVLTLILAIAYIYLLPDHLISQNFGGDGGDFLAAILTRGTPHPSGYPTYVLLGRFFAQLPISTPYFRVGLISALAGALAVGLLFATSLREWGRKGSSVLAGLLAGVTLGTTPSFWSQSVIVEVHALHALMVGLACGWALMLIGWQPKRPVWLLIFFALIFGISIGNHLTILLLSPLLIYAQVSARRSGLPGRWIAVQALAVCLGTLVYLYLPFSARSYPPINWGNPQNLAGLWWQISGQPYQALLFAVPPASLLDRLAALANLLVRQFGVLGVAAGVFGVMLGMVTRAMRRVTLYVTIVYAVFALGYNTADAIAYLLPVWMVFAIWNGAGFLYFSKFRWRNLPLGWAINLALVALLIARIPSTLNEVDARQDYSAVNFTASYLDGAPPDAFLLTQSDADTFPLWYHHFGLQERPDLRVIVLPLTQFIWYQQTLAQVYPDLTLPPFAENNTADWGESLASLNPSRPVCRSQPLEFGVSWSCAE